jgi:S1-C subfamily serine protease
MRDVPRPAATTNHPASGEIQILRGALTGSAVTLRPPRVLVGRHPDAGVRFDPEADRSVSARHAMLSWDGSAWWVEDLGSRNGTYLNGARLRERSVLRDGDRIEFGPGGPLLAFLDPSGSNAPEPGGRAEAGEQARNPQPLRRPAAALLFVAALSATAAAAVALLGSDRDPSPFPTARPPERLVPPAARGLSAATDPARPDPTTPANTLAVVARVNDPGTDTALPGRPAVALPPAVRPAARTVRSIDAEAIRQRNRPAIARVFVESESGQVATGTAFAVRSDALLLTSRHVVLGADGEARPRRLAVQFSASEQVWPARLVASSREADLAILKVDNIVGSVPTVQPLNLRGDTLPFGSPVVALGFPNGSTRGRFPDPKLTQARLDRFERDRVVVRGRSAVGASGSPLFDTDGRVVAILFGGQSDPASPLIFAVPALIAQALVESIR